MPGTACNPPPTLAHEIQPPGGPVPTREVPSETDRGQRDPGRRKKKRKRERRDEAPPPRPDDGKGGHVDVRVAPVPF